MTRPTLSAVLVGALLCATPAVGQLPAPAAGPGGAPATPERARAPEPWRFAGTRPCVNQDGGALTCPGSARTIAVRAGRLFDSVSGQVLTRQVIIIAGERITEIALRWGFNDMPHFSRVFRATFGATPSDLRAASVRRSHS